MPESAHVGSGALSNRRILVVEDEYVIAMEMKRWLQQSGAEVVGPVPSVERAMDLIEGEGLSAAILDINLGDGVWVYPVADRLNAIGVPYLFATGDVRVSDAAAYRDRPRLEKPYLQEEVVRRLVQLLV